MSAESLKNMNRYTGNERKRGQNLLIVEGNHEKNRLFWLLFSCFPEIDIRMDDIWIYGTNIYMLYGDIEREYGSGWEEVDIDFERHDPNFSEEKILKMQEIFSDAADMGKLYLNYPMIESYQHLYTLPDGGYAERKVPVSMQPGKEYKALVREKTAIARFIEFPHMIEDLLNGHFQVADGQCRKECCKKILSISDEAELEQVIQSILEGEVENSFLQTAKYQIRDKVARLGYARNNQTYWNYMRSIFKEIIYHNVCKAYYIQKNQYQIERNKYRQCFEELDLTQILKVQNISSRDACGGYIWVLNTCIFFVAEYSFRLVTE